MARSKRGVPKRQAFGRQERSGRWSASYLHHGVLHRAPATFPTKASGQRWLEDERDLIDLDRRNLGVWTPPAERVAKAAAAKLTLRTYAGPWLEHRNISRRTRENYRYHLDRNILPVLGDMVLSEITPEDVRVWFAGLGTTYQTRNARAYGVLTAVLNSRRRWPDRPLPRPYQGRHRCQTHQEVGGAAGG
jgi:Phage integrase, N-terminal SAM-like domain